MKHEEEKLIGEATAEQIAEWKKKFPGLYGANINGHAIYLKLPTFEDLNCAMASADPEKPFDYWLNIANQTLLGGSDEILKRPELFNGLLEIMKKKIEGVKGKLLDL